MAKATFSTAYLAPIEYYSKFYRAELSGLEVHENYQKQSFRNRCQILSANGRLDLSIPVQRPFGKHTKISQVEIAYTEAWQKVHWKAFVAAYQKSPYFLYYQDELKSFYKGKNYKYLLDFNMNLHKFVCESIGIDSVFEKTNNFYQEIEGEDYRSSIHPKVKSDFVSPDYFQVFSEKFPFTPNLSILDLLFNEGPNTISYL